MDVNELRNYNEWLKHTPAEVLKAAEKAGGWRVVFPGELPRWAHRVRNYFNREPKTLQLLNKGNHALVNLYGYNPFSEKGFKEQMALSGDIYRDEIPVIWLQMDAGGTIYHFKHPKDQMKEAIEQSAIGQSNTPVFKLVSPDLSGGSIETIISNYNPRIIAGLYPAFGDSTIGEGEAVKVQSRIIKNYGFQGSYNYAETTVSGFPAHQKFDIDPHLKDPNGYLNPTDRFSDISKRNFPPKDDKGEYLAEQEKYTAAENHKRRLVEVEKR